MGGGEQGVAFVVLAKGERGFACEWCARVLCVDAIVWRDRSARSSGVIVSRVHLCSSNEKSLPLWALFKMKACCIPGVS